MITSYKKQYSTLAFVIFLLSLGACQPSGASVSEVPIIGSMGGINVTAQDARGMEVRSFTSSPSNPTPTIPPHLEVGTYKKGNIPPCDPKHALLLLMDIQGDHTLRFFYDWNNDRVNDGLNELSKSVKVNGTTPNNVYVCATYYSNVPLRWEDSSTDSTTIWNWEMPRVNITLVNIE